MLAFSPARPGAAALLLFSASSAVTTKMNVAGQECSFPWSFAGPTSMVDAPNMQTFQERDEKDGDKDWASEPVITNAGSIHRVAG